MCIPKCAPYRKATPKWPLQYPMLRIWVRSGTKIAPFFKGWWERTGHRWKRCALQAQCPYLWASRFHGVRPLQRKENSSRDSRRRHQVHLHYPMYFHKERHSLCPVSGISTQFPFGRVQELFCTKVFVEHFPVSKWSFSILF